MSEMIERVARAIYERMGVVAAGELPDDWDEIGPDHDIARKHWMEIGRAAIEAMREPTETMVSGAMNELDSPFYAPDIERCYHAMIDAALAAQEE